MKPTANPPMLRATESTIEANEARRTAITPHAAPILPPLCSIAEIAEAMGVGRTCAYALLAEPEAPKPVIRRARLVRYAVCDVQAWIAGMNKGQAAANAEGGAL